MNTAAFYTNRPLFDVCFRNDYGIFNNAPITDENIWDYEYDFYVSRWYHVCCELNIPTAQSDISFSVSDLTKRPDAIDAFIATMPGGRCFARLDTCSSKPTAPFYSAKEIADHLNSSTRTKFVMADMPWHPIALREWIDNINTRFWEVRCFVVNNVLRGISGPHCESENGSHPTPEQLRRHLFAIKSMVNTIVKQANYPDCTIDLLIPRTDADILQLVEINTPVWLFATSGLFDITLPADVAILCGPVAALEDVVTLPVWRAELADGEIVTI
jgi:hypothetical protein